MKKSLLIAVIGVFALSSCIKTRDCVCKDSSGATTSTTPIKGTKSQSKTLCTAEADSYSGETCTLE